MGLITIYKGDRSVSIDDSPNGLEIMKRGGWTDVQPVKEKPVEWAKPVRRGRKPKGDSD